MKLIPNLKLDLLCKLNFGQHVKSGQDKDIQFLQVKNFTDDGVFLNNVENFVSSSEIKNSSLLKQNDILFVGKGLKFFAYLFQESTGKAIASSVFYVIKVNEELVLPEYIVCILNQPKSIAYFLGASAGSSIPSIRKKELLDFEIPLLSLEEQEDVVNMYKLHLQQQAVLASLKEKKQKLFNQTINQLTENK